MSRHDTYEAGQLTTLVYTLGLPVQNVCSLSHQISGLAKRASLTSGEISEMNDRAAELEHVAKTLRKAAKDARPVYLMAAE